MSTFQTTTLVDASGRKVYLAFADPKPVVIAAWLLVVVAVLLLVVAGLAAAIPLLVLTLGARAAINREAVAGTRGHLIAAINSGRPHRH